MPFNKKQNGYASDALCAAVCTALYVRFWPISDLYFLLERILLNEVYTLRLTKKQQGV